ncbi:hypothetical protein I551_0244 [Mycobacterium ulcerans str. Harvey]|uniref:Uncharacterized protein n=1 Tax=Mycobacterium ulcerans str. Harvey TaxID=1299332 RepID=A0ABN0R8G8_MYCUL|nr:hypothetical protein I551_0244 [Mycobacterium ulcerans str. Harvey]
MITALGRTTDPTAPCFDRTSTTASAERPIHEAMSRRARRARHNWQVFGLAGAHPVVLLVAVASQS